MTQDAPEVAPWIRWPAWVLGVVIVVPLRLVWELLRAVGGPLVRYAGRALAWFWRRAIEPLLWVVWRYVVVLPSIALWVLLQAVADFLARYGGYPLYWFWRQVVVATVAWFFRVTAPFWQLMMATLLVLGGSFLLVLWGFVTFGLVPGWHAAGWLGAQMYRRLLRPVYRRLLRPAAAVARSVLAVLGGRRRS